MIPMKTFILPLTLLACIVVLSLRTAGVQAEGAAQAKKKTLAVFPFIYRTGAEKQLAERMRFAVSAKLSRDGSYDRTDTVQVDQTLSALQIPWSTEMPSEEDIAKAIDNLGTDEAI